MVAALAGPYWKHGRAYLFDRTEPRVPVAAAVGGWVPYAGARIHLDELTEIKNVVDRSRKPVDVGTARVWQATVTFEATKPADETLGGCTVLLEDAAGRRFEDRPPELGLASLKTGGGCARPTTYAGSPTPAPSGPRYTLVYFFLLPSAAAPASVWVGLPTSYPDYARLPRP
jgi:hypothetical protein